MGLSSDGIRERVLALAGRIYGPGFYEVRQLASEVVLLPRHRGVVRGAQLHRRPPCGARAAPGQARGRCVVSYERVERDDDETWEWLCLPTGWAVYEAEERIAIAMESGVDRRTAADLAQRQVGAAGYAQAARPW